MTEKDFQNNIISAARDLGFLVYHTSDSRRDEPGFPDLIIAGYGVVLAWECKTEKGKLREASFTKSGRRLPGQQDWLNILNNAVITSDYVRPSDWDALLDVLARVSGNRPAGGQI